MRTWLRPGYNLGMNLSAASSADRSPRIERSDSHRLDVYLADGQLVDVHLDGESVYPTWFKLEWKETGQVSAKVRGVRMSTRLGDSITIHTTGTSENTRTTSTAAVHPVIRLARSLRKPVRSRALPPARAAPARVASPTLIAPSLHRVPRHRIP